MNNLRKAMFWDKIDKIEDGAAQCSLCPHNCKIMRDSTGFCGIRKNIGGELYATSYGRVSSIALDPVEKKPLSMFCQGKNVLSIGGFGCNFRCPFCQNCAISMEYGKDFADADYIAPEQVAALAKKTVSSGNIGVAYTYNEPFIGYEFVYDCAELARKAGLLNVVVTNGYINREPLEKILPFIDAMNIDAKSFSDDFYKGLRGGLEAVKATVESASKRCHVEVTTLIIPGENDSDAEIAELAKWLASVNPEIPLRLTRFFPRYKYSDREPASRDIICRLADIARKHLRNVFY